MSSPQPLITQQLLQTDILPSVLPGAMCCLRFDPNPQWRGDLVDGRHLHGMLSDLTDAMHQDHKPEWSVWREQGTILVHWYTNRGLRLASGEYDVRLWDKSFALRVSSAIRRSNPIPDGDRFRVTMRTQSLCITTRSNGGIRHKTASPPQCDESVWGQIMGIANRLRITVDLPHGAVRLLRSVATQREVFFGGKYSRGKTRPGYIIGWEGTLIVEASRDAAWLLAASEQVGYGGMTAFGLGRMAVEVVPC